MTAPVFVRLWAVIFILTYFPPQYYNQKFDCKPLPTIQLTLRRHRWRYTRAPDAFTKPKITEGKLTMKDNNTDYLPDGCHCGDGWPCCALLGPADRAHRSRAHLTVPNICYLPVPHGLARPWTEVRAKPRAWVFYLVLRLTCSIGIPVYAGLTVPGLVPKLGRPYRRLSGGLSGLLHSSAG